MTISTLDGIVAATKRRCGYYKNTGFPTHVIGAFHSYWATGPVPAAGSLSVANLTTGAVPTSATTGAMNDFIDPSGGNAYLLSCAIQIAGTGHGVILADRVWHAGSFAPVSGAIAGFTGATAVDRPATGAGVEAWVEINTAFAATAHTVTITYVNQAGTGSRTATCAIPASAISGRMFPFVLQAGDSGIRSISAISGSSTPASGSYNIVLLRRLASLALTAVGGETLDFGSLGFPEVYASSCLFTFGAGVSTTAPTAVNIDPCFAYG